MISFKTSIVSLVFAILVAFGDGCLAQSAVLTKRYSNKTFLEIESLFDEHLKSGYHPYQVTIRNGTDRPITWTINYQTNANSLGGFKYSSVFEFKVEPGSEVVEEIYTASPPTKNIGTTYYREYTFKVNAPGLSESSRRNSSRLEDWPAITMSKRLAQRNITQLADARKKKSRSRQSYFGSAYSRLPINWKGYTGLDVVLIDDVTWGTLPKDQRDALLAWVRFGGHLEVFTEKEDASYESLGIDNRINGKKLGVGVVEIRKWDGKNLDVSLIDDFNGYRISQFDNLVAKDFLKSWGLLKEFGKKDFNPALVFILLIIFAVLVGPVNLFYFAKPGRRHRLFITTPIISVLASLIIIVIILLQDGLGGSGMRAVFVQILSDADQRKLQIAQNQISRTGVMFRSGFENKDQPLLSPVALPPSRWNPLSSNSRGSAKYRFDNGSYSGDLFRSRNEQGYYLQDVRPTRSRVEIRGEQGEGGTPQLVSSLEFPIGEFFYIDQQGKAWKSESKTIEQGANIVLVESNSGELKLWLNKATEVFGKTDRNRIKGLSLENGRYFATAHKANGLLIDTHPAVRWNNDRILISGHAIKL